MTFTEQRHHNVFDGKALANDHTLDIFDQGGYKLLNFFHSLHPWFKEFSLPLYTHPAIIRTSQVDKARAELTLLTSSEENRSLPPAAATAIFI